MREQERYNLTIAAAEAMYNLWELGNQKEELSLDGMMMRLKNLSAYSLTHAEIMNQREGVELLALAMFFGATSNPRFHKNRERLRVLSEEALAYQGRAEIIEEETASRKANKDGKLENSDTKSAQMRLL
jgi:hypothetical protein